MAEAIRQSDHIVVTAHVNPDGDAVGALCASGHMLRAMGKEFVLYASPALPQSLSFLSLPCPVRVSLEHLPFSPRSALLFDCNEPCRLGQEAALLAANLARINVDHHPGGGMGDRANWIMPDAAATTQLVAYVALTLNIPLRGPIAEAVAVGLIADTGGFRHSNTKSDVFLLAAHLAENGCDIPLIRSLMDNTWSLGRMRLWAALMSQARMERRQTIVFCRVALTDLQECQCVKEDLEGFAEFLLRLRGVKAAALLREETDGVCRFSLRSAVGTNVLAVASVLGGGGHVNAAGGTLPLSPEQAEFALLDTLTKRMDEEDAGLRPSAQCRATPRSCSSDAQQ
ncbi:MAG: bifunctional oligoribonuclease/PAP phosphatase NrnA [Desulfovibrio sp.]|nr:bifunctional oligoribonuclease/PAP phosphatase NrnA [Desulfovibrio sp.]